MNTNRNVAILLAIITVMMVAFVPSANAETTTYVVQTQDGQPLLLRDEKTGEVLDKLPNGTYLEVIRIENGRYHRAYVEYEGVSGLYVYSDSIVPADGVTVVQPVVKPEKVYSKDGCELYRVKLDVKKWVNIQLSRDDNGGTAKRIYRGDEVWVKKFGKEWATIIMPSGHARFVRSRFLEKVTENSEPLVTPLGEYVTNEKAVNLRKSPDVMADPVVKLKKGEHVWVVEDLGAWAKVADENGRVRGYVMTYFLDLVQLAQPEPVQFSVLDTELHTCVCGTESCTCGAEDCDCGNAAK